MAFMLPQQKESSKHGLLIWHIKKIQQLLLVFIPVAKVFVHYWQVLLPVHYGTTCGSTSTFITTAIISIIVFIYFLLKIKDKQS